MKGRTIRRVIIKAMIFARKAAPYVLAGLSAAGTIAVTVEAVKEIKKNSPDVIYVNEGEDLPEDVVITEETAVFKGTKYEIAKFKVQNGIKTYWKPVSFCIGSLTCQAASVFIFTKRQQQLIIATHQMEELLHRYSQAAGTTALAGGAVAANKLEPAEYPEEPPFDVDTDGLTQFWDPVFNYWFRADERDFLRAAKDTSHAFAFYGAETVENFYLRMGADPPTDSNGDGYIGWGWNADDEWVMGWQEYSGYVDIDFSSIKTTDDGLEYRIVNYFQGPEFNMELLYAAIKVIV